MPLITEDIFQARSLFNGVEVRAQNAEVASAILQSTVDRLTTVHASLVEHAVLQQSFVLGQIQVNAQQTAQQAAAVSPDLTLDNFIASLGLSIALAEATMPDRTISAASATVQSFLTFAVGPDGKSSTVGLRLYQPELGAATALATTSFDLTKIPGGLTSPAQRSLYAVLQEKQALYSGSFWTALSSDSPPAAPATQLVAEIVNVFAAIGNWSFPYLLQEAAAIAAFESSIAVAVAASPPPGTAPLVANYASSVANLSTLIAALNGRAMHVAGDLYALTSALDVTTTFASTVHL
jgi:hypothetical protein